MERQQLNRYIQLKPSDDLHRSRRNFLFVSGLLFVVAVVNPQSIALPGFTDAKVPGPLAISCLVVVQILLWVEYWVEYRVTYVSNNESFAGLDGVDLDQAFDRFGERVARPYQELFDRVEALTKEFGGLKVAGGSLPETLNITRSDARHDVQAILETVRTSLAEGFEGPALRATAEGAARQIEEMIDRRLQALEGRFQAQDEAIACRMPLLEEGARGLAEALRGVKEQFKALRADLARISDQIHGVQRAAFIVKDKIAFTAFAGAALGIGTLRLVTFASKGSWFLDWPAAICGAAAAILFGCTAAVHQLLLRKGARAKDSS